MSKGRNQKPRHPDARIFHTNVDIPEAISHGISLIEAELARNGQMVISLAAGSYRKIDSFDNNGQRIEVGLAGNSRPALRDDRLR